MQFRLYNLANEYSLGMSKIRHLSRLNFIIIICKTYEELTSLAHMTIIIENKKTIAPEEAMVLGIFQSGYGAFRVSLSHR